MIALVTGSRDWTDKDLLVGRLEDLEASESTLTVVEGGARGADRIAGEWAEVAQRRGVGWVRFTAEWSAHAEGWCAGAWCQKRRFCVGAGPRRNQEMLDWVLNEFDSDRCVLAFKDGFDLSRGTGGTEDCVRRAKAAGIPGRIFQHTASPKDATLWP